MYIAGLNTSVSSPQVLEALVVFTTFDFFRHLRSSTGTLAVEAESKGGRVRADTVPVLGRVATAIHALAIHVPPIVYIGTLVLNKLRQPEWMAQYALPSEVAGVRLDPAWIGTLRVGGCIGYFALKKVMDAGFRHLGDQWHALGRRERPRVIQTGPYAWVRHPLYSMVLLMEAQWSVMFWSYVPLVALVITAAAFAVKMPIEEAMIERDEGMKEQYESYKQKVPARIVPFVW